MRPLILTYGLLLAGLAGCQQLHWPGGQVIPPPTPELAVECPPCEIAYDPCNPCYTDPCFTDPCYTGEYIMMDADGAYIMPGTPVPTFPQSVAPFAPPAIPTTIPQTELPGWFDVMPGGSAAISPDFGLPSGPRVENPLPNPLVIPVANGELAWDQLTDVVSTYFPISREQPVQLIDGVLAEGFIETPPRPGATFLEPGRKDVAGSFNRWQSTLQSVRRRAYIRVMPTAGGWAIEPQVFKELEDLPHPEHASAGTASMRNDNSLPTSRRLDVSLTRESINWIPLGRDEPLEQKMLREIQERLTTGQ